MQQTQQLRQLAARSATAFLLAVLCVYPLYIDKFSNPGRRQVHRRLHPLPGRSACWAGGAGPGGRRAPPGASARPGTPPFGHWESSC